MVAITEALIKLSLLALCLCDAVAVNAASGAAAAAAKAAAANQAAQQAAEEGSNEVIEQALYLLPLFPMSFMSASKHIPSGESRTIRLSTADSRGARYAEFL